jgi:carbon storage regulator
MLVLSRKRNEELLIGPEIRVVVMRIQGTRVTLGVITPGEVRIKRAELPPLMPPEENNPTLTIG